MKTCECGCGGIIEPQRWHKYSGGRFLRGHHTWVAYREGRPPNQYKPRPEEIPSGFCECGCGRKTDIPPRTLGAKRWFRGHPKPFVFGHGGRQRDRGEKAKRWNGGRYTREDRYI